MGRPVAEEKERLDAQAQRDWEQLRESEDAPMTGRPRFGSGATEDLRRALGE